MSVTIYNLYEDGQYPMLSAMGVILLLLVLTLSLIGSYIGRRFGVKQDRCSPTEGEMAGRSHVRMALTINGAASVRTDDLKRSAKSTPIE